MFTSLLSKKKRLIQRLWKMRRSCFCRDSPTKNLDESCEIFAKHYPKNDFLLEKFDVKELFFDVLSHFTTENLEILFEELSSNSGKVCPCLTINDAEFSKKSKILSKKLSKLDNLRIIKHLLFHFFVLDLKSMKNKVDEEKPSFIDRDQSCDTKNLQFMTLPWCSCDNRPDSICLNPFHVALSHSNNEKILFHCGGETIECRETENDLHSIDCNDAIHQSGSCTAPCVYYLAYWEQSTKIGNSLTVDNSLLFCFNKENTNNNNNNFENHSRKRTPDLHFAQYCDLCGATTSTNVTADDDLKPRKNDLCRTIRQKIGRGFALYVAPVDKISNPSNDGLEFSSGDHSTYYSALNRDDDGKKSWRPGDFVVLQNRSPLTLYIQSNFLTEVLDDEAKTKTKNQTGRFLKSRRLLPGQAIIVQKIGFFKKSSTNPNENDSTGQDSASVLISFSKCWGLDQKRHLITYCPCWVEVIFPIR